jgi:hypothetical protein
MNAEIICKWTDSVGGVRDAVTLIMGKLKCSPSKASKLATGRYPSVPNALEQEALAQLVGCDPQVLFAIPRKKRSA